MPSARRPGVARNVHVVQPFVDVVRDHDLQLLRIRMRRREFPEAAVAQMHDGVGISFHQSVSLGHERIAVVRQGVVTGVYQRYSVVFQRLELLFEGIDVGRSRSLPAEQLFGPLEVYDVVVRGVAAELFDRAHDLVSAGADAVGEQPHERVVRSAGSRIDDQNLHAPVRFSPMSVFRGRSV